MSFRDLFRKVFAPHGSAAAAAKSTLTPGHATPSPVVGTVTARRYEHWIGAATPVAGPDELLWLRPDRSQRILGFDPETGERKVDRTEDGGAEPAPCEVDLAHDVEASRVGILRAGTRIHDVQMESGSLTTVSVHGRDVAIAARLGHPEADGFVTVVHLAQWAGDHYTDRRFALHTAGSASVVLTGERLAVADGVEVLWLGREALARADDVKITVGIEDVVTPPPPSPETAVVDFIGGTTGLGFVRSQKHGRLRFDARAEPGLVKGASVAIEVDAAGNIARAWALDAAPRDLPKRFRTSGPVSWSVVERAAASAKQELSVAAARNQELDAERSELAAQHRRESARMARAAAEQIRRGATHRTAIVYDVDIRSRDGAAMTDEAVLRAFDGLAECSGELLGRLTDDECYDGVWLLGLVGVLRFDEAAEELRFAFEFYCEEAAGRDAQAYLAQVSERLLADVFVDGLIFEFPEPHVGATAAVRGDWIEIETTALPDVG